jgi:TolB protein
MEEAPAWSPDGSRIAFVSNRDGDVEIYVMKADGSDQIRLTDSPDFDGDPAWSPDGERIAFTSLRDGNGEIYVMNADGTNPVRLTNNEAHDWGPAWSPDGSRIAFVSERDGDAEVYVMNADGTEQTNLTNFPARIDDEKHPDLAANEKDPAWSPDGKHIAFTSDRHSFTNDEGLDTLNTEIYVMNADGTNQTRLTHHMSWDEFPTWSPDGKHIVFIASVDVADWEVFRMDADGSNPANLTNNPANDVVPDWSP